MKSLVKYIVFLMLVILLNSCDNPSPTELILNEDSDEELSVEVLSPEPNEVVYSNGYDSTGITSTVPRFASIISISGIKNTMGSTTYHNGFGLAIFFDKNQPYLHNGSIIGHRARAVGRVSFGGDTATVVQHRIRYIENGQIKSVEAGLKHVLLDFFPQSFFKYNSNVNFELKFQNNSVSQFDILTPPEITGQFRITGSRANHNLSFEIRWNKLNFGKIEVIIGGKLRERNGTFPLFRVKTRDDGFLRIPLNLVNSIPFNEFDQLVITLIRKYDKEISGNHSLTDLYVASQSIHNIRFAVPQ